MAKGDFELNALGYYLADGTQIVSETAPAFGEVVRPEGGSTDRNILDLDTVTLLPPIFGFGRNRVPSDKSTDATQLRRFFRSTCETRYEEAIYLPLLGRTNTVPANSEVVRRSVSFKSNLYTFWDRDDGGVDPTHGVNYAIYDGTAAGNGTWNTTTGLAMSVENTGETVCTDAVVHKNRLVIITAAATSQITFDSTDGTTWTAAGTTTLPTGLLTTTVTANDNGDFGRLATTGSELVAVLWHEDSGTITFYSSTDSGDTWADESTEIASANGPHGVAVMADTDNIDKLWVATKEGIHAVDTSVATWTSELAVPMNSHLDNGRNMIVHSGILYFGHGVDNDSPAPMSSIDTSSGFRVIRHGLGIDNDDGVPSALLGPIQYMKSSGGQLFVSVGGGAASREAHILVRLDDPRSATGGTWHYMAHDSTGNRKINWFDISADEDGVPRLHWSLRTATATTTSHHLEYPLTNPSSGVTLYRSTSGYIHWPYLDLGMPTTNGAVLQIEIGATGLGAATTNNNIDVDYGVNGAARTTGLGDYLSSTTALKFASGAGVEMFNTGLATTLEQDNGSTTTSPEVHAIIMRALKHVADRERFTLSVDIARTAAEYDVNALAIMTQLRTARDLNTLPAFVHKNSGTLYVKVMPWVWQIDVDRGGEMSDQSDDTWAIRGGILQLTLQEILG
jgi:hypothetical protein